MWAAAASTLIITSLTANSPMMMLMKFNPAMRSTTPKVRRTAPVRGFWPMRDESRPMEVAIIPFRRARPERLMTRLKPMNIRAKYSGGPNASATLASRGAKKVSPTSPRVPATKEEMAEIPRAAPARPCLAIS